MPSGFLGGGVGPRAMGHQGLPNPVPVAGAELLTNGDMELDDASWSNSGTPTTNERSTDFAYSGTYSRKVIADTNDEGISQARAAVTGWHVAEARIYSASIIPSSRFFVYAGGYLVNNYGSLAAGTWHALAYTGRWTNLTTVYLDTRLLTQPWYVDNVSLKPLTLASLLSTRTYASANCDLSAAVTRTAGTQAGLVARLDSATSPANFIIAYLDGAGNVKADKCVAGVYTNVISGAVSYADGRVLRLVCSGNDVSAYYNGSQVGSTVTVSDAGIVSNLRHGKFSTYASNTLTGFVAA